MDETEEIEKAHGKVRREIQRLQNVLNDLSNMDSNPKVLPALENGRVRAKIHRLWYYCHNPVSPHPETPMLLMKRNSYESISNPPKQSEEMAEISKRSTRNLGWSEAVEKFEENCKRLAPPSDRSESPWNPVDCL